MRTALTIELDPEIRRRFKTYLASHGLTAKESILGFIEKTLNRETK